MGRTFLRLAFLANISWILVVSSGITWAQTSEAYLVYLRDKAAPTQEFLDSFHPNAIQRRQKLGVTFPQWDDLPLVSSQVAEISRIVDSIRFELRWFGAVSVQASPSQVNRLKQLPFVLATEPLSAWESTIAEHTSQETKVDTLRQTRLYNHVRKQISLDSCKAHGLDGSGVRMAVFDAGFKDVDTHAAFDHIRKRNGIVLTKDFYGGKGADVYYGSLHGTSVLGCIAGNSPYGFTGAATGATFLLARTEHSKSEKPIEEDYWMAAAEWADQQGADIISSSLGYSKKRYEPGQMDGKSTLVSRAAAVAVRKGILVVNSAGNEGSGKFRVIAAPADADSVLSVGASYPMIPMVMPFSSRGPNARGILKPEISAPGYVLTAGSDGKWVEMPGTSFACPLVAGIAACALQANPDLSNIQLKAKLMQSGHCFPYYDFALGFGVLDARYLFHDRVASPPSFDLKFMGDTLAFIPKDTSKSVVPAGVPGRAMYLSYISATGQLLDYHENIIAPGQKRAFIPAPPKEAARLKIWFQGYLMEVRLDELKGK